MIEQVLDKCKNKKFCFVVVTNICIQKFKNKHSIRKKVEYLEIYFACLDSISSILVVNKSLGANNDNAVAVAVL